MSDTVAEADNEPDDGHDDNAWKSVTVRASFTSVDSRLLGDEVACNVRELISALLSSSFAVEAARSSVAPLSLTFEESNVWLVTGVKYLTPSQGRSKKELQSFMNALLSNWNPMELK